ncbi:endonuclease domain-containing protein [Solwaraspora sp. WMMB762]|uniref:endonuclease domain-containing protein n=1 Tax=Solwaraspora sp. WMMB762 TaxID=3404120 RepID=UPI003B925661
MSDWEQELLTSTDAPAVVVQRTAGSSSQQTTVAAVLDELEATARQLFPTWLPGAEGITTSAGAARAAVRRLAVAHAAATAQSGPFLADLAAAALTGSTAHTRRHHAEVRARGLARVIAASFDRPGCALVLRPPDHLDETATLALAQAAQWLVDHGRLTVWIDSDSPYGIDSRPRATEPPRAEVTPPPIVTPPARPRRESRVSTRRTPSVIGKPHPTSRAEVVLEAALARRAWAAGRAWNHTVRPGPLVNPVRVDLLWKRERCVVEIDGDDHRTPGKFTEDRHRDVMLQLNGYAVLRFTNAQVLDDIDNVLVLLQQFLTNRRRTGKGP